MQDIPAEEFAPVTKHQLHEHTQKQQLLVLVFVTFITLIILTVVLISSYVTQLAVSEQNTPNLDKATWSVTRVAPTAGSTTDMDLTLTSSIGNVRHYNGIRSYGLSNDRQKLVVSNANVLQLIDLPTDTQTKINPAFDYNGDQGNAISWTAQDDFFVMAVYKSQAPEETHVVVYTSTGEVEKDIKGYFATHIVSGNTVVYPVKLDSSRNLFIARVYKSEDQEYYKTQNYTVDQLPISLRVYNLAGDVVSEISVRDATIDNSYVTYFWDQTGNFLVYKVVPAGATPDYTDEASFTQVAVQ